MYRFKKSKNNTHKKFKNSLISMKLKDKSLKMTYSQVRENLKQSNANYSTWRRKNQGFSDNWKKLSSNCNKKSMKRNREQKN